MGKSFSLLKFVRETWKQENLGCGLKTIHKTQEILLRNGFKMTFFFLLALFKWMAKMN